MTVADLQYIIFFLFAVQYVSYSYTSRMEMQLLYSLRDCAKLINVFLVRGIYRIYYIYS